MTSLKDFKIEKKLGEGAFGTVYKTTRLSDQQVYAIKQVKISNLNDRDKMNALNEVRILASIQHQNVVAYKEAFFQDETGTLNMVMEYADGGDLY